MEPPGTPVIVVPVLLLFRHIEGTPRLSPGMRQAGHFDMKSLTLDLSEIGVQESEILRRAYYEHAPQNCDAGNGRPGCIGVSILLRRAWQCGSRRCTRRSSSQHRALFHAGHIVP